MGNSKIALRLFMPGEVDDATISTKDITVETTNLAEQIMLDLADDVYEDRGTVF